MPNKPFSTHLYYKYDKKAKKFAIKILEKEEFIVEKPKNKKSVDLIVRWKKVPSMYFYVETEIKRYLSVVKNFDFDTLHLPKRKKKFCELDRPTLFMLFSEEGDKYLCVWSTYVLKSPLKEIKNRYVKKGELFFDISIKYVDNNIKRALKRDIK
jgi:hypothetical protein